MQEDCVDEKLYYRLEFVLNEMFAKRIDYLTMMEFCTMLVE